MKNRVSLEYTTPSQVTDMAEAGALLDDGGERQVPWVALNDTNGVSRRSGPTAHEQAISVVVALEASCAR